MYSCHSPAPTNGRTDERTDGRTKGIHEHPSTMSFSNGNEPLLDGVVCVPERKRNLQRDDATTRPAKPTNQLWLCASAALCCAALCWRRIFSRLCRAVFCVVSLRVVALRCVLSLRWLLVVVARRRGWFAVVACYGIVNDRRCRKLGAMVGGGD